MENNFLSDRINALAESETLAMTRRSRELKAQGFDVINLSIGEPDFNTPEHVKDAAKEAIDQNFSHYPPVPGYPELREAIALKLKRDNNLDYKADQIVVSTGAKQALANAILCLLNPGDEVIVPAPFWVSYKELIKLAEAKAVYINTTIASDYKVTPSQIEAAITPSTKLFIFNSPCNPSGTVYTHEELKAFAEVFERHPNIFIISDEIYEYINFTGKHYSIASFGSIHDRVIIINGLSKGFAMTGWRLGYLAACREIAKACDKLQGQFTSGTCSISQRAAITAMKTDPAESEDIKSMIHAFKYRRDLAISMLKQIPGITVNVPDGAFYLFPEISQYFGKSNGSHVINSGADLCDYILDTAYVALVPGSAFGTPNCIRISYATSEDNLQEAIRRIETALSKLS
ncbi:MAG TPA: pyridoxal phosphate-dependent aminotransferase [Bacteroidales bacterium]|nr:pyridoxal phosphate-dependent aminotransferase [Bacteroidales bacterium]HPT02503.1 pyridoxal phosphate-dependent aminotransferase [Bacteroidales bacterium]